MPEDAAVDTRLPYSQVLMILRALGLDPDIYFSALAYLKTCRPQLRMFQPRLRPTGLERFHREIDRHDLRETLRVPPSPAEPVDFQEMDRKLDELVTLLRARVES